MSIKVYNGMVELQIDKSLLQDGSGMVNIKCFRDVVLKKDHEAEIALRDLEIKMLKEQRNQALAKIPIDQMNDWTNNTIIKMDQEIETAKAGLK